MDQLSLGFYHWLMKHDICWVSLQYMLRSNKIIDYFSFGHGVLTIDLGWRGNLPLLPKWSLK